jgi:hypothetical protein
MSPTSMSIRRLHPSVNPAAKGWLLLDNQAIARLAALEILKEAPSLKLTEETQDALKMISIDHPQSYTSLKVWIETDGLDWLIKNKDTQEHRETALKYCVERQAHYPLMVKLFNISRQDLSDLRKKFNAELPPAKPKRIASAQLDDIYNYWRELQAYANEIDRWVLLGLRFPHHTLSSLYTAIWVEPATNNNLARLIGDTPKTGGRS